MLSLDRGLLYGDGFFDTLVWRNGACTSLPYHDVRIQDTARALHIPLDWKKFDTERTAFFKTLLHDSIVRTTITRGLQEQRGLWPTQPLEPNIYFTASPWTPSFIGPPVRLIVATPRRNAQSSFASFKTLNYLENVIAAREAAEQNVDDALMLNTEGFITGTTIANLWWVENDILHTPPLTSGAIRGTVRARVMEQMPVVEKNLLAEDFLSHTLALTSNAVRGFRPVANEAVDAAQTWATALNKRFFCEE
jgi:branched-chain amino acid aminotransferase